MTLGGTVLFCAGVRSGKFIVRMFGLLLQCVGLYLFLSAVWYPFRAPLLINSYFLSCFFIAFSTFFSAYYLESNALHICRRDRWTILLLLFLGTLMWYVGGLREIYMKIIVQEQLNGVLLFIAATSIITGIIGEKSQWKRLDSILMLQLPMPLCVLTFELFSCPVGYPLLIGWGTTVWPVTLFIQYRVLAVLDGTEWSKMGALYHLMTLWMFLFISCREFILKIGQVLSLSLISIFSIAVAVTLGWFFVVRYMARKRCWPVAVFPNIYLWGGVVAIGFFLLGCFIKFTPL